MGFVFHELQISSKTTTKSQGNKDENGQSLLWMQVFILLVKVQCVANVVEVQKCAGTFWGCQVRCNFAECTHDIYWIKIATFYFGISFISTQKIYINKIIHYVIWRQLLYTFITQWFWGHITLMIKSWGRDCGLTSYFYRYWFW